MEITAFREKLNRLDDHTYMAEEEVHLTDGVYEAELSHDNIDISTLSVHTGPKLTGDRIEAYTLTTPSLMPWKRVIRVYANAPVLYISYETLGDTVEADDINRMQAVINATQEALNGETERAGNAEEELTRAIADERNRAVASEKGLAEQIGQETARALEKEAILYENIREEVVRAGKSEAALSEEINAEIARAQAAEKANADNLAIERQRAVAAEKANTDAIMAEANRSKDAEKQLQSGIDLHTESVNTEITALRAADAALESKKANTEDVNKELANRYTKSQTYSRQEVLDKIKELIGAAPDTLDTFKEIADALGNDPDFAATITAKLGTKVDKVDGKGLSSNDYTSTEKSKVLDAYNAKHTHGNKTLLDGVTQILLDNWSDAYNKRHTHSNKGVIDGITTALITAWNNAVSHISQKNNPHGVTKAQVGLGNVENKTAAAIRAGMTKAEVVSALGYTPAETAKEYTHPDSGVKAGTYKQVTVNAQGHVTGGTNPATLSGYGIKDAVKKGCTWGELKGV